MKKQGKTALVLAGGGLTGAVYEIGALRAIDDLLIDRSINDFDVYIGTSAGALVSTFIANGVSPEEMLQVINGEHPRVSSVERKHIFNLNWFDYARWGARLPSRLVGAWAEYLRRLGKMTLFDLLWALSAALPAGLYESAGLEKFVRIGLQELGYSNNFNSLQRELYIIATDLDSGERAIFGRGFQEPTVSQAVAASSAFPMMYKPVRIDGRDYIDGGTRGTASIDLAIEQGANLVVCINPMVPFDNQYAHQLSALEIEHLSSLGAQSIVNQAFRILLHSGLHYHIKQVRRLHPEVEIILIEPKAEDRKMFFYNIMHYSARQIVARHGFESVTLDLAMDYPRYKETLARFGIPITRRLVIEELAEIRQSNFDPGVIRRILEARNPHCSPRQRGKPICRLSRSLAELEMALSELGADKAADGYVAW